VLIEGEHVGAKDYQVILEKPVHANVTGDGRASKWIALPNSRARLAEIGPRSNCPLDSCA